MDADIDVRTWLRSRGAETVAHPGGTLYAHLCRVQERLAEVGHGAVVQSAGLTHAVYGTDGFDIALLDWTDRAPLRHLVGADAEALVYLYGACDRGRTWRRLATSAEVVDRFTGEVHKLRPEQLGWLIDLSIVNELDVIDQDPLVADRHRAYFREIFSAWAPFTSAPVDAAVQRVLRR
ncbi:hypothetical protein HS048_23160 [Planomonospora sp. ID91781]|uniref:DUF6817 domain-containing protein n=1 Tax=Planomonospora sp. ID91781 TaxID=2738135 RepID=UPI0018C41168|nr:hypothetical protein [Planomonospora sp. ID91781]MBG0823623.1 hypothetical protein [Planomonospora sp. ID91781]